MQTLSDICDLATLVWVDCGAKDANLSKNFALKTWNHADLCAMMLRSIADAEFSLNLTPISKSFAHL